MLHEATGEEALAAEASGFVVVETIQFLDGLRLTGDITELRDEAASEEKLTGLCRILFNASEFVYVD